MTRAVSSRRASGVPWPWQLVTWALIVWQGWLLYSVIRPSYGYCLITQLVIGKRTAARWVYCLTASFYAAPSAPGSNSNLPGSPNLLIIDWLLCTSFWLLCLDLGSIVCWSAECAYNSITSNTNRKVAAVISFFVITLYRISSGREHEPTWLLTLAYLFLRSPIGQANLLPSRTGSK